MFCKVVNRLALVLGPLFVAWPLVADEPQTGAAPDITPPVQSHEDRLPARGEASSGEVGEAQGLQPILSRRAASSAKDDSEPSSRVVLLVHGLTQDVYRPSDAWGHFEFGQDAHWTGMIGYLMKKGFRCGGLILKPAADLSSPGALDTTGTTGDPQKADLFVLQLTFEAAEDGAIAKGADLAACIEQLCKFTGAQKVTIVAHSAGGYAARVYLQNAIPGIPFRSDVDRLITVATPHLGAAAAENLGDLIGTRVSALKPDSATTVKLCETNDLPEDVDFASIVVRSISLDVWGDGSDYDKRVDHDFLAGLPIDYRKGGDYLLSVRTQNLRLAACAGRFETNAERAVQYVSARVPSTEADYPHTAALSHMDVQNLVYTFLTDDGGCWQGPEGWRHRGEWIDRRALACAVGAVGEHIHKEEHPLIGVVGWDMYVDFCGCEDSKWHYHFLCDARWHDLLSNEGLFRLTGTLWVDADRFGRIINHNFEINDCRPVTNRNEVSAETRLAHAREYLDKKLISAAIDQFDHVLRGKPKPREDCPNNWLEVWAAIWAQAREGRGDAWAAKAKAYQARGDSKQAQQFDSWAINDYTIGLSIGPPNQEGHLLRLRGLVYHHKMDHVRALADFTGALRAGRTAIQSNPGNAEGYNSLAWLLATCPDATIRDGKQAVLNAQKACDLTSSKDARYLDTLAAACAEAGDFAEAVKQQQMALKSPGTFSATEMLMARKRLLDYRNRRPYREE